MMPLAPRPVLWLCIAGATLGAVGLLGHILSSNVLIAIVPRQPAMMPNTALGLVLIGSAGALRQLPSPGRVHKTLSVTAALIVLAIGIGSLAEYALDSESARLRFRARSAALPRRSRCRTACPDARRRAGDFRVH
jgi:hypothetical protein